MALVVAEAAVSLLGGRVPALSVAVLLLAPGLALLPLLPERVRSSGLAAVACSPGLGYAASSVALVSASGAGVPITGLSARLLVAAIVVAGVVLLRRAPMAFERPSPLEVLGLTVALVVGTVLAGRVVGSSPVPGNDWAQYVLYGDEVRRHGSLATLNPFWMLGGLPFREDPAVPALYGAFAGMAGGGPSMLAHGIWVFALVPVLTVFGYVRAYWGALAGVAAAGLWAVLPVNHDILAWHGLANVAALGLIPLLMAYAGAFGRERIGWLTASGAALVTLALIATHRLSLLVAAAGLILALLFTAIKSSDRRALGAGLLRASVVLALLCPGVAAAELALQSSSGGTQSYTAYLGTKVDLGRLVSDLTLPFTVVVLVALGLLALRRVRSGPLAAPVCLLLAEAALAYAWLVHFPLYYVRIAYFLPLALVPLVAVALAGALRSRPLLAGGLALLLTAGIGALAWGQARDVRDFYAFSDPASLRGLDAVAQRLHPGEVVVADRCWSFQATWLLHTRTLSALDPSDILPRAELAPAAEARAIIAGTPEGLRRGRQLGVRYMIVDPTCTHTGGRPLDPPGRARAVYVSTRLAVFSR